MAGELWTDGQSIVEGVNTTRAPRPRDEFGRRVPCSGSADGAVRGRDRQGGGPKPPPL